MGWQKISIKTEEEILKDFVDHINTAATKEEIKKKRKEQQGLREFVKTDLEDTQQEKEIATQTQIAEELQKGLIQEERTPTIPLTPSKTEPPSAFADPTNPTTGFDDPEDLAELQEKAEEEAYWDDKDEDEDKEEKARAGAYFPEVHSIEIGHHFANRWLQRQFDGMYEGGTAPLTEQIRDLDRRFVTLLPTTKEEVSKTQPWQKEDHEAMINQYGKLHGTARSSIMRQLIDQYRERVRSGVTTEEPYSIKTNLPGLHHLFDDASFITDSPRHLFPSYDQEDEQSYQDLKSSARSILQQMGKKKSEWATKEFWDGFMKKYPTSPRPKPSYDSQYIDIMEFKDDGHKVEPTRAQVFEERDEAWEKKNLGPKKKKKKKTTDQ